MSASGVKSSLGTMAESPAGISTSAVRGTVPSPQALESSSNRTELARSLQTSRAAVVPTEQTRATARILAARVQDARRATEQEAFNQHVATLAEILSAASKNTPEIDEEFERLTGHTLVKALSSLHRSPNAGHRHSSNLLIRLMVDTTARSTTSERSEGARAKAYASVIEQELFPPVSSKGLQSIRLKVVVALERAFQALSEESEERSSTPTPLDVLSLLKTSDGQDLYKCLQAVCSPTELAALNAYIVDASEHLEAAEMARIESALSRELVELADSLACGHQLSTPQRYELAARIAAIPAPLRNDFERFVGAHGVPLSERITELGGTELLDYMEATRQGDLVLRQVITLATMMNEGQGEEALGLLTALPPDSRTELADAFRNRYQKTLIEAAPLSVRQRLTISLSPEPALLLNGSLGKSLGLGGEVLDVALLNDTLSLMSVEERQRAREQFLSAADHAAFLERLTASARGDRALANLALELLKGGPQPRAQISSALEAHLQRKQLEEYERQAEEQFALRLQQNERLRGGALANAESALRPIDEQNLLVQGWCWVTGVSDAAKRDAENSRTLAREYEAQRTQILMAREDARRAIAKAKEEEERVLQALAFGRQQAALDAATRANSSFSQFAEILNSKRARSMPDLTRYQREANAVLHDLDDSLTSIDRWETGLKVARTGVIIVGGAAVVFATGGAALPAWQAALMVTAAATPGTIVQGTLDVQYGNKSVNEAVIDSALQVASDFTGAYGGNQIGKGLAQLAAKGYTPGNLFKIKQVLSDFRTVLPDGSSAILRRGATIGENALQKLISGSTFTPLTRTFIPALSQTGAASGAAGLITSAATTLRKEVEKLITPEVAPLVKRPGAPEPTTASAQKVAQVTPEASLIPQRKAEESPSSRVETPTDSPSHEQSQPVSAGPLIPKVPEEPKEPELPPAPQAAAAPKDEPPRDPPPPVIPPPPPVISPPPTISVEVIPGSAVTQIPGPVLETAPRPTPSGELPLPQGTLPPVSTDVLPQSPPAAVLRAPETPYEKPVSPTPTEPIVSFSVPLVTQTQSYSMPSVPLPVGPGVINEQNILPLGDERASLQRSLAAKEREQELERLRFYSREQAYALERLENLAKESQRWVEDLQQQAILKYNRTVATRMGSEQSSKLASHPAAQETRVAAVSLSDSLSSSLSNQSGARQLATERSAYQHEVHLRSIQHAADEQIAQQSDIIARLSHKEEFRPTQQPLVQAIEARHASVRTTSPRHETRMMASLMRIDTTSPGATSTMQGNPVDRRIQPTTSLLAALHRNSALPPHDEARALTAVATLTGTFRATSRPFSLELQRSVERVAHHLATPASTAPAPQGMRLPPQELQLIIAALKNEPLASANTTTLQTPLSTASTVSSQVQGSPRSLDNSPTRLTSGMASTAHGDSSSHSQPQEQSTAESDHGDRNAVLRRRRAKRKREAQRRAADRARRILILLAEQAKDAESVDDLDEAVERVMKGEISRLRSRVRVARPTRIALSVSNSGRHTARAPVSRGANRKPTNRRNSSSRAQLYRSLRKRPS